MKIASRIPALLLIAALMLVMGAWTDPDHADALLATPDQHRLSCHAHNGNSLPQSSPSRSPLSYFPRQVPVRYQCCLTGHVAAVVPASEVSQPSAEPTGVIVQIEPARTASFLARREVSALLFPPPPGTTILRI